jgi:CxxC motif-containing protein (DUF1111 family)
MTSTTPARCALLLSLMTALAAGCRQEPPAPKPAPAPPLASARTGPPWPLGFEYAELKARAEWRSGLLASGRLDEVTRQSVERGKALFLRTFTPEDGLGPSFNERSCVNCHNVPEIGGRGTPDKAANVFGRGECETFGERHPLAGVQFKAKETLPGYAPPVLPDGFVFVGKRVPPPLLGLGWVEAIDATQIFAGKHCEPPATGKAEVCGWAPPKPAGHGTLRFGMKMVAATIDEFVAAAFERELGLTTLVPEFGHDADARPDPEITAEQIIDVSNFIAFLPAPGAPPDPTVADGAALFEKVGCADCHRSKFDVAGTPAPQMYSDLLAHDLGAPLAEKFCDEITPASVWRTAPLWGLRRHPGPYLHDGRATTLEQAIQLHGGEAQAARQAYETLSPDDRGRLVALLNTL